MPERPLNAPPRVWLLASYRAGENGQLRALADALGEPWEHKAVRYRGGAAHVFNLARRTGTLGIHPDHPLQPPWPRVLISAGLRNEPVARWVQAASNGYTRLVFVGRTWAPRAAFDLIITTPQYRLPVLPNVLHNPITLHNLSAQALAAAREQFASTFAHLPRPHVGLLVGGDSGPYALRRRAGQRLATAISNYARGLGGSVLATTSARTHPAAGRALEAGLDVPHLLHRWRPQDPANPYLGILASADVLVVTSDSIAMLSEALSAPAPTLLWDLQRFGDLSLGAVLYRLLQHLGPQRLSRDVACVHQPLLGSGRVQLLDGSTASVPAPAASACEDLSTQARHAAVARVRALL